MTDLTDKYKELMNRLAQYMESVGTRARDLDAIKAEIKEKGHDVEKMNQYIVGFSEGVRVTIKELAEFILVVAISLGLDEELSGELDEDA